MNLHSMDCILHEKYELLQNTDFADFDFTILERTHKKTDLAFEKKTCFQGWLS